MSSPFSIHLVEAKEIEFGVLRMVFDGNTPLTLHPNEPPVSMEIKSSPCVNNVHDHLVKQRLTFERIGQLPQRWEPRT